MKYRVQLFKKLLAKCPNIPQYRIYRTERETIFRFCSALLDPAVVIRDNTLQQVELFFYKLDDNGRCNYDSIIVNMVDAIALLNLYFYD